jgi:transposase
VVEFVSGKISRSEAATLMGVGERTVTRMAQRYRSKGLIGLEHGNRGRNPSVKKPDLFKSKVLGLMKEKYFDFNLLHAQELLSQSHQIEVSRETLRRWCHEKGLVKRAKRRKGVARRLRERMPSRGMMLQMDGSPHRWNNRDVWHLIHAIDDATSEIPYAEFFESESTPNTMKVLRCIVERNGIPWSIYVDKAGCFGSGKRRGFNQFRRACEELGIRVFFAHSPQAKGRIERANQTFQDRLIPELRLYDIWKKEKANEYLKQKFLPNYWERKCRVEPRSSESKYRSVPPHIDLREVFCLKYRRTVNGDHTVQWRAQTYQLDWPRSKPIRGHKVEFRIYPDGTWKCFHAEDPLKLDLVIKPMRLRQKVSLERKGLPKKQLATASTCSEAAGTGAKRRALAREPFTVA